MPAKGEKKMEEEKEVTFKFTVLKLLKWGAIAAVIVGLLWGILAAVGWEGASGSLRFSEFLQGLFFAILGGGVLAGLAEILERK
ncbi:MAG TPA: hypothetical protein G4O13_03405 [Dehalococcoidia bacterium]|nr:hypothetical protein [Dehalococcoidia bacterium]